MKTRTLSRRSFLGLARTAAAGATLTGTLGCSVLDKTPKLPEGTLVAKVEGTKFCIGQEDGSYQPVFLDGVNMGVTTAGSFPGEFAIDKDTYKRWFGMIADMGATTIRVYVNLMPAFYDALLEFNKHAKSPLYLIQGVYANEDMMVSLGDAFGDDGEFQKLFLSDIINAVDMVHGSAEVDVLPGNAGGTYTSDVSPWTIGWIIGIEWPADFVIGTNEAHPDHADLQGTYVRTEGASPFETFLAEAAEKLIEHEMDTYGTQRPLALCNWCTTDPLDHPNEPDPETEDAVPIDPEHICATDAYEAGFFASYHVYPYYPDFLSYDVKYVEGDDPNPYRAYLEELVAHHSMPVLVAEYGIPASRGIAHVNAVTHMSQGFAREHQQGEWLLSLRKDIMDTQCMGAFVFTWQDEWFKRTWNSMDLEDPERRPFWHNVQSPEECFGLLALEPGEDERIVCVDGDDKDWSDADAVMSNDGLSVYAKTDAEYLYLLVRGDGYDFEHDKVYIPIDVIADQGNLTGEDLSFERGVEFLVRLRGREDSDVLVDAYYDAHQYLYSVSNQLIEPVEGQTENNSGHFDTIWLAMNRGFHLPETNDDLPFESFETGHLTYGIADPESDEYDSIADFCAGEGFVELRLPWNLIGFMDPSTKLVMDDFHKQNAIVSKKTDGVWLGVCREGYKGEVPMSLFTWDDWEIPAYHERLKESYYLLQDALSE